MKALLISLIISLLGFIAQAQTIDAITLEKYDCGNFETSSYSLGNYQEIIAFNAQFTSGSLWDLLVCIDGNCYVAKTLSTPGQDTVLVSHVGTFGSYYINLQITRDWNTSEVSQVWTIYPDPNHEINNCSIIPAIITTGISGDDIEIIGEALAYPNPSSGYSTLSWDREYSFEIFSSDGKLVTKGTSKGMMSKIYLSNLGKGIYFARMIDIGDERISKTIRLISD